MSGCQAPLPTFFNKGDQTRDCSDNSLLLTMEIEFSLYCNYNCPYCYVPKDGPAADELTSAEIRNILREARSLGVGKIIILGGEPMIYSRIFEHIEFITSLGMEVDLFTNGSNISPENASRLLENQVNVVLKKNSFKKEVQDLLTGKSGSHNTIENALHNLKQAGYPSEDAFLAISSIICSQNFDELAPLWTWCRDQDISPYFEIITPQEGANRNDWLQVDIRKVYELFNELSRIDREKYGIHWDPQPPLVGTGCMRHQFSAVVHSNGDVTPCVGLTIPIGNIREKKLEEIIKQSEVISNLKNYKKLIKGPCKDCEKLDHCYGCRGAAYQMTGDYLASDPLCWKNINKKQSIQSLPVGLENIIPQKSPMRIVDYLEKLQEREFTTSVTITPEMPFINADGSLERSAYMEIIAQSAAAEDCFVHLEDRDHSLEGMIVGGNRIYIHEDAKVGDELKVNVTKITELGNFGIVYGKISKNHGATVAEGEIKIWQDKGNSGQ
ncbi:MAG: radical SAM protein [Thermodesulfobacteriota bacterium]